MRKQTGTAAALAALVAAGVLITHRDAPVAHPADALVAENFVLARTDLLTGAETTPAYRADYVGVRIHGKDAGTILTASLEVDDGRGGWVQVDQFINPDQKGSETWASARFDRAARVRVSSYVTGELVVEWYKAAALPPTPIAK